MMNILGYIKNVKEIKKNDLLASIRTEMDLLRQIQEIVQLMKTNKVKIDGSDWVVPVSVNKQMHKVISTSISTSTVIENGSASFMRVLDHLSKFVEKEKQNLWNGESLTIKQANVLTLLEQISFWSRYTELMLDGIISQQYDKDKTPLTQADMSFLNKTLSYYVDITVMVARGADGVINKFNELLDGQATEEDMEILEETHGVDSVSPFERGLSIHHFLPMYWIRNMVMNFDLFRLKSMDDKNKYYSMKIAQIAARQRGENDPMIDYQIGIYQDKIIKNRATAERIRSKYN